MKHFPKKKDDSWWICFGTEANYEFLYRFCWDGCSIDYPQRECDRLNQLR